MPATAAIVGRPNVGKSTLFNRLAGQQQALVDDQPGVTRDRLVIDVDWNGRQFQLVDTAGIQEPDGPVEAAVLEQVEVALESADLILFVVDSQAGISAADERVAERLRRVPQPVMVVVNKIDHPNQSDRVYEFYRLGFEVVQPVSGLHGRGTGDLLDRIVDELPPEPEQTPVEAVRVAVVGRPNAGKSTLVNQILGHERVTVSDIPGTTRDAVDVPLIWDGQPLLLIDTAGMRRKARVNERVERKAVSRSIRAIERSHITLILLDATRRLASQDQRIAGLVHDRGRGSVIVVNKWDLVEKDNYTVDSYVAGIEERLPFLSYAPIIFISAKTGQRVHRILPLIQAVRQEQLRRLPTSTVNDIVHRAVAQHAPASHKGRRVKIYYGTQVGTVPPVFLLFTNHPEGIRSEYRRYLERELRRQYAFEGTPVRIHFRSRRRE